MFRAMSTRRDYRGYDELIMLEPKLSKSRTVPAAVNFFSSSSKKVTSDRGQFPGEYSAKGSEQDSPNI
ncbi:hypothetical protein KY290_015104 [Solanum tuberosum]|uniref:Uncharacterized protein n=1 Tax=Solanum tuberosum TaxID=4113 RepID=A0ABQ7VRQ0_SOLTU|nr:hypothetical protein KY290_015104 [Solanum tuberosum]